MLQSFTTTLAISVLCFALNASADNFNVRATVTTPVPTTLKNETPIDCSRPNHDARCRPPAPEYRPYPYRRPVIVNPVPSTPPIDVSSLKDDWDGCRSTKLNAIHSRHDGNLEQANRLDEWLWKNCRSYSDELRDLEQDQM